MRRSEGCAAADAVPPLPVDALLFDTHTLSELMDIDASQCSAPSVVDSSSVTTSSHSCSSSTEDDEEEDHEDMWQRPSMNDALMDAILFQDIETLLISHPSSDVAHTMAFQIPHTPASSSHTQSAGGYSPMPFVPQQREDATMIPMATVVDWLSKAVPADVGVTAPSSLQPQEERSNDSDDGDDTEMTDVDASEDTAASDKAYSVRRFS